MAITSGVAGRCLVDEFNLSGSVAALQSMRMETGQQNSTTVQDEAMRRTPTLRHGSMTIRALFDDAAGASHPVLSTLPTTDRQFSYLHRATAGAPAWACIAKQLSYNPGVSNGELFLDISAEANNYGLELGHTLTAGVANSTGAENLTGVDDQGTATTTNFGLQAFLHVISFTGTSVTVTIQDSDDDGAGDAYAAVTGGAFTAATGVGTERIATGRTQAVKRYLRLALSGTYSNADIAVVVVRNTTAVEF